MRDSFGEAEFTSARGHHKLRNKIYMPDFSKIALITTGGTIAGVTKETTSARYSPAVLNGKALLQTLFGTLPSSENLPFSDSPHNLFGDTLETPKNSVQTPNLPKLFEFGSFDSANVDDEVLLSLARFVENVLKDEIQGDDAIEGVVITHGTDSLEESALFLELVLNAQKPIVFTGSMRASNALGSDGARNLYNAFLFCAHLVDLQKGTQAESKSAQIPPTQGIFIALGDSIFAPFNLMKFHTSDTNAFEQSGAIGRIVDSQVFFSYAKKHLNQTLRESFALTHLGKSLPKVEILYSHQNDYCALLAAFLFVQGIRGIVVAGMGNGSLNDRILSAQEKEALVKILPDSTSLCAQKELRQKEVLEFLHARGLVIVISSRVPFGTTTQRNFLSAWNFNPQKARILLMLLLQARDSHVLEESRFQEVFYLF